MATSSGALSGFPARTTLAFAGALAVIPAFAGDAVALIEMLTGPSQRVELMTYAHVGQVIHLSADQTMVLSYREFEVNPHELRRFLSPIILRLPKLATLVVLRLARPGWHGGGYGIRFSTKQLSQTA
jgi:hypothetical protein